MDYTNATSRKIRKPLMERKRRARINHSLDELQQLLMESEVASRGSKLEKADILEMTVQYLRRVRHSECGREVDENVNNALRERYLLGFEKCGREMEKLLLEARELEPHARQAMLCRLSECLERERTREGPLYLRREGEEVGVLPSELANGDVLLLLSSSGGVRDEGGLNKSAMWRPWW